VTGSDWADVFRAARDLDEAEQAPTKRRQEPIRTSFPPTCDDADGELERRHIDYPDYDEKNTFVVSGPLPHGKGPGRPFVTGATAQRWAQQFYGERYVGRIHDAERGGRWAVRVKKQQEQG
jgi:hypothetical protein